MTSIAIDLRMLHASGIGTYVRNLVPRVMDAMPNVFFHLLGNVEEMSRYPWAHRDEVRLIDCRAPIYSVAEQRELTGKIPKDASLLWVPHFNIPLFYRGKLLVTVHDVFHLAMPHYVGGLHKRLYAKMLFSAVRAKADRILCPSNFTKEELHRLAGTGREAAKTVHNGVDASWFQVEKEQRPHENPYLLYVGNVKPHKNLVMLLEAFERVADRIPHDLVIVGKKEGFITGDAVVAAKAATLGERVRFTGFVEDAPLKQYFAHADAMVFPSLYEGFGLPPLEAMACGCPVISSTAASLPEVCGEAALYCDPHDPQNIAEQILRLVQDTALQEDLRQKGRERAQQFTWETCARETVAVIREVLSK